VAIDFRFNPRENFVPEVHFLGKLAFGRPSPSVVGHLSRRRRLMAREGRLFKRSHGFASLEPAKNRPKTGSKR